MNLLYTVLYSVLMLLALPYFLVIGLLQGKYLSSFGQRLGFIRQRSGEPSCWIHAVSVGELLAAKPLIKRLREEYPALPLYLSTTTITGQKLASALLPDRTFYFPFDWRWCIRKVFARLQPSLILILETEIWPNFLREARKNHIPVLLINGRLSDRSFARYRLFRRWLPHFDEALMQSEEDAIRMRALGACDENVEIMGNLKFDFQPPILPPELRNLLERWKTSSLLWIAGSTMSGEEPLVLDAFQSLKQEFGLKLLLAPRHPERLQQIYDLLQKRNVAFVKRSHGKAGEEDVMVLDTMGELAGCYQFADVVFVGGTLVAAGGHNPIEPAYYGKAVVTGPYYENFRAIFGELKNRNAIVITSDLRQAIAALLRDDARRAEIGRHAGEIVRSNAGATQTALEIIGKHIDAGHLVESRKKLLVR